MTDPKSAPSGSGNNTGGYANPPEDYRWKPGQSGNPSGKKKGAKNIGELFRKVAHRLVKLANGKKATMMELVMQAPMTHGMKGDAANAAYALELVEKFGIQTAANENEDEEGVIYIDWSGKPKVNIRINPEKIRKERIKIDRLLARHEVSEADREQIAQFAIAVQKMREGGAQPEQEDQVPAEVSVFGGDFFG